MKPRWTSKLLELFRRKRPHLTERSRLDEFTAVYSDTVDFFRRRYGITLSGADRKRTLEQVTLRYGLPPATIVFMELQLEGRSDLVASVAPREAAERLRSDGWRVFDVREDWELAHGGIAGATALGKDAWSDLMSWDRTTPILLYCHFGIRSMDAAHRLIDEGFTRVHVLRGGIDAWAVEVDPTLSRYEGAWC